MTGKRQEEVPLYEGLLTTRAIRRYTDEPVPDEDAARHPVRGDPGAQRIEPPALPLRRPHRRARGAGGEAADRRGGTPVLGRQAGGRRVRHRIRRPGRLPQGAHGPHHAALRRHLRIGACPRAGLLRALPPYPPLHRRCIRLSRLPEPAARGAGPRVRRRHDRLAVRRRCRVAVTAAHPRRGGDHGDHHARAARRDGTDRCADVRCPSWSTGIAGARPPPGRSTRTGRPTRRRGHRPAANRVCGCCARSRKADHAHCRLARLRR